MGPDEALLFKCFDTKAEDTPDVAKGCTHTAFQSDQDYGDARESVEFRCLVFWDDQPMGDECAFNNPARAEEGKI
jgi:hypothetical protein